MGWNEKISRFTGSMTKKRWLVLLAAGTALMLLSLPWGGTNPETERGETEQSGPLPQQSGASYEGDLERRIQSILKNVQGVGTVDVMVVLKSTEEKVFLTDRTQDTNTTDEQDSQGGRRISSSSQSQESAVLAQNQGTSGQPVVEKELSPEISGIIISASGGGSPKVQSEISQAMEALFGLPPHKIKVLKRVE